MKKARSIFALLGAGSAAASAFSTLKSARGRNDKLALVNAVASILVAITGAALAVRGLRKDGEA
ncbi:hypothetical protein ABZ816_37520 [Actinosynnema sp. NPDC047251]|uniref:Putative secreted protein n=1 Tax=Saccharothrix espanaensis (strain ATCC 51144 / DSM 44229 / JCM 9112 / NBRC 15066 / NRRL 15764) TaxID=1179773 RepID=K0K7U7_SACES|nr:hypothetical protein [Saccharothrix espanaensis]CCH34456.1 putative secreted protein [Saccharothrix espanaensis DSM 44229]